MAILNKFRRLLNPRSFSQILISTGVLLLAAYFIVISSAFGKPKHFLSVTTTTGIGNLQDWPRLLGGDDATPYIATQFCNPTSIKRKEEPKVDRAAVSCKQHVASENACTLAKQLYYTNSNLKTCGYSRPVEICSITENRESPKPTFNYKCSMKECMKYKRKHVLVWGASGKNGHLEKLKFFTDWKSLQRGLGKLASDSVEMGFHFLILECTDTKEYIREKYDFIGQMLLIPPIAIDDKDSHKDNEEKTINLNFILLDSAARSHFYRSLPETIATLSKINENSKESRADILDFELFQSLEGHTAENIHGLFTGKLFPRSFTGQDKETSGVNVGEFFKHFTSQGYSTTYQDDLCFDEFWGMRLDLGSPSSWDDFVQAQKNNNIDNTGLTFSSCKLLSINNVTNPFNGPDGPLCFNGRFTDAYHLDWTYLHHEFASRRRRKLISFSTIDAAHDHTGTRIQSMDSDFARYVRKMATSENTLTIIFADHGNTYTHYTHAVMEGRFEQFHPSLFMIVPEGVQNMLGGEIMQNLRANQYKLFTLLDVRKALINIPIQPKSAGIFGPISSKRACDDLDLRLPNLCVCEGWDAETTNNTQQIGLLHFAVGQLNNKIQLAQQKVRNERIVPKCQMLVPTSFFNVRERNKGGSLITSMDFTTNSGNGASNDHDVFHVELQSDIQRELPSRNMKLLSFDRMSKYGPYTVCSDKGINMRLCVCDIDKGNSSPKKESIEEHVTKEITFQFPRLVETADISVVKNSRILHCMYLRTIAYPEVESKDKDSMFSINYEVANICNLPVKVQLKFETDNMKPTTKGPFEQTIPPFTTQYIVSAIREVPYWDSTVKSISLTALPELD